MLTTAAHAPSHNGPSVVTSSVVSSSGRLVAPPVPRRRQRGSTRRTVPKISCTRISLADAGNGEAGVRTLDPPRRDVRETTVEMRALVKVHLKDNRTLDNKTALSFSLPFVGSLVSHGWLFIQLVSSELDQDTGSERTTKPVEAEFVLKKSTDDVLAFEAVFKKVPASFGSVGAVRIDNDHDNEMFIEEVKVSVDGDESSAVTFYCNSWVIAQNEKLVGDDSRVFFPIKSYLPSQTPKGLERLRKSELQALRGNGNGIRTEGERIYDYDVYNDLGDSEKDNSRPALGGSDEFPYPRRCRTGRLKNSDSSEKRPRHKDEKIYVPRDEAFSKNKAQAFGSKQMLSKLHAIDDFLLSKISKKDLEASFPSLAAIDKIYHDDFRNVPPPKEGGTPWSFGLSVLKKELSHFFHGRFGLMVDEIEKIFKFETPQVHDKDKLAWFRDEEFARETLAGVNPMSIQLVKDFPIVSQLDEITYGRRDSLLTKELIEAQISRVMTAEEAVKQKKLFMLDYHDALVPYVEKVREQAGTTLYGSRTLFFLAKNGTLKPIAIELTRPKSNKTGQLQWRQVFTPDDGSVTGSWLWQLAKTHVVAHDSGYHQLVNHWLRTHCCVEPYIIAANRQLSQMHPIYRLLHPHFRYTMGINALARKELVNAGGAIESNFSPLKYSMELSSAVYKNFWLFDMEALPEDLIRRGMAFRGTDGKLELTIKDYPYANDGLLIWDAIEEWVSAYVKHYYPTDEDINKDDELLAWWGEVRDKGHPDKKDGWLEVNSHDSLIRVLTTIIWVSSGHHAAVNFGQYPFAGYIPNRPSIARKNMPTEKQGGWDMEEFQKDPEKWLLDTLPSQKQALEVLVMIDLLSSHDPDEQYMGTYVEPAWNQDETIRSAFNKFQTRLKTEVIDQIDKWNADPDRRNRHGPGVVPYTLLRPSDGNPFDEKSQMDMGIPNSISI